MVIRLIGGVVALAAFGPVGWFAMSHAEPVQESRRDQFAQDRAGAAGPEVKFDAERALGDLRDLCRIGTRISGSDGMRQQQQLLSRHFEACGGRVELQRFTARQHSRPQPTDMANLIVSWHPERTRRIILCSHYDTRPIADQEPDRRRWHDKFLSANDGGSGVALLMELARHLKGLPTEIGVDFVLFDGEEYVFDPEQDQYFFGSEHFARGYRKDPGRRRYVGAVLLDMIAGKGARFPVEQNSLRSARPLVRELWQIAADLECRAFRYETGPDVRDDHLALNAAGIPCVDVIDMNYAHWHRLSDVPENCSADSLGQVARVLVAWLQRVR